MTERLPQRRINRAPSSILLAIALLLPVATGGSALAEERKQVASFDEGFAHVTIPMPEPEAIPGAVDITEIDPPLENEARALGTGIASFYGKKFHGRRTASGQRFDMHSYTAAHRTLPFGSKVRVTNPRNGKSVVVRINDRGPYAKNRTIDLSRRAAEDLGIIRRGHAQVELELLDS